MTRPSIMFIAGENSGDQHAARLIREIRLQLPEAMFFGFGGQRMESEGMLLEENLAQKLPIVGITQVIRNYGKLKALLARAAGMLRERRPDLLVLVDYPGFNLRTAKVAKALGIPVLYYISPQIWAWHKDRLKTIAETVTQMLVILPFEEAFYRQAGVPVAYVGHPLQDDLSELRPKAAVLHELGIDASKLVLGLLPGSRNAEVVRHMPIMLEAASRIVQTLPNTCFLVPCASTIDPDLLRKYTARYPDLPLHLVTKDLKSARGAMDFAVCKSGTSTLELALLGVPMVIMYRVSWLSGVFIKAVLKIPHVGLVNIVAGKEVVPELLQENATAPALAQKSVSLLQDPEAIARMKAELAEVKAKIGEAGASRSAAGHVVRLLKSGKSVRDKG